MTGNSALSGFDYKTLDKLLKNTSGGLSGGFCDVSAYDKDDLDSTEESGKEKFDNDRLL